MWKNEGERTVNMCEEACVVVGKYKCQVKDTVEIEGKKIRIRTISGSNSEYSQTVDINTVMKGESAYDFFVKCLLNQNQKVFVHFLDHIPAPEEGERLFKPEEGGALWNLATEGGEI